MSTLMDRFAAAPARTVVVVGATGSHAYPAAEHLLSSGKGSWSVIAVVSSTSAPKAQALQKLGCTLAVADVDSKGALAALLRGVHASAYAVCLASPAARTQVLIDAVKEDGRCSHLVLTAGEYYPTRAEAAEQVALDALDGGDVWPGNREPDETATSGGSCLSARAQASEQRAGGGGGGGGGGGADDARIAQMLIDAKLPYTIVRPAHRLEAWLLPAAPEEEADLIIRGTTTTTSAGITVRKSEISVPFPSAAGGGKEPVPLVTSEDVGGVIAAVLSHPAKYVPMKEVAAVSQLATADEVAEIFGEHYGMKTVMTAPHGAKEHGGSLPCVIDPSSVMCTLLTPQLWAGAMGMAGAGGKAAGAADERPYSLNKTLRQALEETRDAHPHCTDLASWLRTNPMPAVDSAVEACIWGIF